MGVEHGTEDEFHISVLPDLVQHPYFADAETALVACASCISTWWKNQDENQ